jgi:rhodanese-related sulfurtransferase
MPASRSTLSICAIRWSCLPDPFTLPGALHFSPDSLAARHLEIPRDRDVVLFCTCPSEATAAKTAMTLHKLGIERVRPSARRIRRVEAAGISRWTQCNWPQPPKFSARTRSNALS